MSGPPPPPRGPYPPNTALYFEVGEHLTVKTKAGDVFTGTIKVRASEYIVLVGEGGQCKVWTGAILSMVNHRPRR